MIAWRVSHRSTLPPSKMDGLSPILYQSGYLTIKSYNQIHQAYRLGIPNCEVHNGLAESLVRHLAPRALKEAS